jgi:hypothetical protein
MPSAAIMIDRGLRSRRSCPPRSALQHVIAPGRETKASDPEKLQIATPDSHQWAKKRNAPFSVNLALPL